MRSSCGAQRVAARRRRDNRNPHALTCYRWLWCLRQEPWFACSLCSDGHQKLAVKGNDDDFAPVRAAVAQLVLILVRDGECEIGHVPVFHVHVWALHIAPMIDGPVRVADEIR